MDLGVWILLGGLIGVVMMVLIAALVTYRKYIKPNPPPKNHGICSNLK